MRHDWRRAVRHVVAWLTLAPSLQSLRALPSPMHLTSRDALRATLRPRALVLPMQQLEQKERPHKDLVELLVSRRS